MKVFRKLYCSKITENKREVPLRFAHDIALLEYLAATEKGIINYLYAASKKQGVKINMKKTKGDIKHLHPRKNTLVKWKVIKKLQHIFTSDRFALQKIMIMKKKLQKDSRIDGEHLKG